jgi:hypothetical protein
MTIKIQNIHISDDTFDAAWPEEYGRAAMTELSDTQYTMSYEI